jgi:hypothetical protein
MKKINNLAIYLKLLIFDAKNGNFRHWCSTVGKAITEISVFGGERVKFNIRNSGNYFFYCDLNLNIILLFSKEMTKRMRKE